MLAIAAVIATFATIALVASLLRQPPPPTAEEAHATQVLLHPRLAPQRVRCDTCGTVEGIRVIEAAGSVPRAYVLDIRMPDGSLRQSSEPRPGSWKVGDQIQLFGGERSWNQGGSAN